MLNVTDALLSDENQRKAAGKLVKKSIYDEMESENYIERGMWQDSPWNCDYRDNAGNLTWYANEKNKEFLIMKNSGM